MSTLADARQAFERKAWTVACDGFIAADAERVLEAADLAQLAVAASLSGRDALCTESLSRAHAAFLERGDVRGAANAAVWLAFQNLDNPSHQAQATGWLARARRLVDDAGQPCVEEGWLECASAVQRVNAGDITAAYEGFSRAVGVAGQFADRDLVTLARHGQGRVLLALDRIDEGFTLLDEAMIAVTAGEVGPIIAGIVYCSVLSACSECFDLARAQEWTSAFERWCAAQPDLVSFRSHCLVRRSQILQFHGAWNDALSEAHRAHERIEKSRAQLDQGFIAYQLGELHRLRGSADDAEHWYRVASLSGRKPHPGLALLRFAQGDTAAAEAAIRLALRDIRDRRGRVFVLAAAVDILVAAGAIEEASAAADELRRLATAREVPFLHAAAAQADGAVALARRQDDQAVTELGRACDIWRQLDAPYEVARTRVLIGQAYRALGDREGADLEFDAAEEAFEALGAVADARRLQSMRTRSSDRPKDGLTGREVEVLRLIATGATNRAIASQLHISEKTVARHISNIFTKLDLASRAAATAYAYQHKLIQM